MSVVRIEHGVPDYEAWKVAFDADPIGRARAGVQRYRVLRDVGDPSLVFVDLELETPEQAEAFVGAVRELWARIAVVRDPSARVAEVVEQVELAEPA
jgi:hypothetical protein